MKGRKNMKIDRIEEYLSAKKHIDFEREELIELYWRSHPRFNFFKYMGSESAKLLDIGANQGALHFWRKWEIPNRQDLKLYGVDLQIGKYAEQYEEFKVCNLDENDFPFPDKSMDLIYSTHVIEHLKNPGKVASNIFRCLKKGGFCYIEVPNHNSLLVPSKKEFLDQGVQAGTTNFYDDPTHLHPYSSAEIWELFGENRGELRISAQGTIVNEWLAEACLNYAVEDKNDVEMMNYGVWLKSRWSDYIIIEKI